MQVKIMNEDDLIGLVMTRGIRYGIDELSRMRIIHIYNASGDHDMMGADFQMEMIRKAMQVTGSPWILSESSLQGRKAASRVITVFVFADQASMGMYALRHEGIYGDLFAQLGFLN